MKENLNNIRQLASTLADNWGLHPATRKKAREIIEEIDLLLKLEEKQISSLEEKLKLFNPGIHGGEFPTSVASVHPNHTSRNGEHSMKEQLNKIRYALKTGYCIQEAISALSELDQGPRFTADQMQAYAQQARADLEAENARLRKALTQIFAWNQHPSGLAVDYGSNGVRDFYRDIANAALGQKS